jgi:HEAT repeat protein
MSDNNSSENLNSLQVFKAISVFISSIIIAGAGIFVTSQYNSNQLEISRNKDLATLIPQLGSQDATVRKFSAISLALYGKYAVPALMVTLDDENQDVRVAAVTSLSMIGEPAIRELTKTYQDKCNSETKRSSGLYTLGRMRAPNAYELAASALEDPKENPWVRKDAAMVMGFLKEKRSVERLLSVLRESKERDVTLTSTIVWALGEIQDVPITDDLISLLDHPDETVRIYIVTALGKIGNESTLSILSRVESNDKSETVRQAAKDASAWIKRRG